MKRPAINKQIAYLEFKENQGKAIEDSILQNRNEMKEKRNKIKDMTNKINMCKKKIDSIKVHLDKKEDERRMDQRAAQDNFDEDE